jgi:very-short-patch-repair endonuclease
LNKPVVPNPFPLARNRIIRYDPALKQRARKLRRRSTYSEVLLWQEIRRKAIHGYQFHRQVPILNYIVDFYCHELRLAIEVDGDSHKTLAAQFYDVHRQKRLEQNGVRFLRFDDLRMKQDIDKVVEEIKAWIIENQSPEKSVS